MNFAKDLDCGDFMLGEGLYAKALQNLEKANLARSKRRDDLDQCPATAITVLRRVMLLLKAGLKYKSILLLGDDDLLSVALSVTDIPCQIVVVDLDPTLLEIIKQNTDSSKVRVFLWDLRKPLPSDFIGQYDMIFTDPPYTLAGQLTFLEGAVSALRCGKGSSLFFCASRFYLRDNRLEFIFDFLRKSSLEHMETHEDFNEYVAPPDVLKDIKRRYPRSEATTFHSTLFCYASGSQTIRRGHRQQESVNIYSYDNDNASS